MDYIDNMDVDNGRIWTQMDVYGHIWTLGPRRQR
jgi:hypothetical protein